MRRKYDAVIIGGGIIGSAIAYELAKSSKSVAVFEKNAVIGSGSTCNSCAIVRTHYSTLNGAALAKSNYPFWERWREYIAPNESEPLAIYREFGCIYTCFESNNYGIKLEEIANQLDIPYEVWTPSKMRAMLPVINPGHFHPAKPADDPEFGCSDGDMRYVLYFPKAGFINDPQLATQNIAAAASRNGADILTGQRIVGVNRARGRVEGVELDSGETIESNVVVNAAGPHSYKVNDMAGVSEGMNIGTKALRVEVAHVPSPEGFDFEKFGLIGSDADIGGYWRPEVGNHILFGSEEPECDAMHWVDPDDYDTNLSEQARLQALRGAQRFPEMRVPNSVQGIVDLYDVSDDWIPIYDCSDLKGFYMAVGTSGNQFKNAPVVGMMMKSLIDYCEAGNDHDACPLQYELPNMEFKLDMAFCSRKRIINRESSFSVVG
ncbi:MAG: FAD-dependent oxidoreductase [Albidovulum sp.]|nr:FAD-dependent oxidoreductase [Albidovulum sp.]